MNLAEQLEIISTQDHWQRCEQARELIFEGLRSPQEAVRLLAAGLAAGDLDPELAAELERLFEDDPADRVRAQAVAVLGSVFEEMGILESWDGPELSDAPMTCTQFRRIQRKLEATYRNRGAPEEIRRRALEALVRSPEAWHREAVLLAWSGGDLSWRATAVRCMGHVEAFEPQILEALGSDSPDLRHAALETLLENPLAEAGDEILRIATCARTPRELRLTAFEVLMALRPRGSLEALGSLLDSEDKEIAEAAGEAFAELAGDEGLDDEFEPSPFAADDPVDVYGFYEGECAGCDVFTRVDDVMLCEECAGKLDRDMIRQRDWDYSATAWACPETRREELRALVIREHGAKLELIASDSKRSGNGRGGRKRKRCRKRPLPRHKK